MTCSVLKRFALLILPLLAAGCGDSDSDRDERAAQFTTSTKAAPNPQREDLESLIRKEAGAPAGLPGAPKFELYSTYKGEDIRQVTGVSGRSLLLTFTAPWCPYSNQMRQALQELARMEKGSVQVIEVNADEYPILAEEYAISKVPTTILYTEGVKLRTIYGYYDAISLLKYLLNVLSQEDQQNTLPTPHP